MRELLKCQTQHGQICELLEQLNTQKGKIRKVLKWPKIQKSEKRYGTGTKTVEMAKIAN